MREVRRVAFHSSRTHAPTHYKPDAGAAQSPFLADGSDFAARNGAPSDALGEGGRPAPTLAFDFASIAATACGFQSLAAAPAQLPLVQFLGAGWE